MNFAQNLNFHMRIQVLYQNAINLETLNWLSTFESVKKDANEQFTKCVRCWDGRPTVKINNKKVNKWYNWSEAFNCPGDKLIYCIREQVRELC